MNNLDVNNPSKTFTRTFSAEDIKEDILMIGEVSESRLIGHTLLVLLKYNLLNDDGVYIANYLFNNGFNK